MKIAIVGCGLMGHTHASNLAKMPGVELVGAFDNSAEAAERVAAAYHTKAYVSFDTMMIAEDPDIVCVLLPTPMHKEFVIKSANYGKHVFCEKPIAGSLEEAEEMIAYCERKGVKLFIGHVVRFFPAYSEAQRRIAAGELGRIGVARTRRVGPHPGKFSKWYNQFERSGGVIMDLMIHDIDFLRWVFGEVRSVYTLNYRNQDTMDYALVTLQFDNREIANLEAYWGYPGQFHYALEISGREGLIHFDSREETPLQIFKRGEAESSTTSLSPVNKDPYYLEMLHFIDHIRDGKPLLVTPQDARINIEIAQAAMESARTGLPVYMQERGVPSL
ncbi:Gfo/Idh/MocA family protein [Cohnella faecalis]|uniref:Gfo/Idh/MocA family oxidoreductase n=1 Tax=Cohnella faecalis TaxID=2315694 RepID=A0A398CGM7_9BACL|nr:Gfo/Idh/MocA family oxidoreductase [Cohnella faecalis]RIE01102.1 gfo/Idh/MocA family oxidoreductase [Cohnella faecalis]